MRTMNDELYNIFLLSQWTNLKLKKDIKPNDIVFDLELIDLKTIYIWPKCSLTPLLAPFHRDFRHSWKTCPSTCTNTVSREHNRDYNNNVTLVATWCWWRSLPGCRARCRHCWWRWSPWPGRAGPGSPGGWSRSSRPEQSRAQYIDIGQDFCNTSNFRG